LLRHCIAQNLAQRTLTLLAAVDALVRGGRASLTHLGRAFTPTTTAKHRIKRVDRLLSNARLQLDLPAWYGGVAARLLRGSRRPVILIDWTEINVHWWSLTAAVAVDGRAIPIYNEVHPPSGNGTKKQLSLFIARLRKLIPAEVRPTLVADAGFCRPFMKACRNNSFDLVVRLRGGSTLRGWEPDCVTTANALASRSGRRAKCLGTWSVYDANRAGVTLRVVVAKRTGLRRREDDGAYRKRAVQSWVLATTREDTTADGVVALYATRMRIEETFRDAKNPRLGWSLSHAGNRSAERLAVLMLAMTLSLLVVMLVGAAADAAGCTRFFQANTTRHRAVLSLFRIGLLVLAEFGESTNLSRMLR
jgi:hypothetical protein